jgi:large-conductance mechanosensitive channel
VKELGFLLIGLLLFWWLASQLENDIRKAKKEIEAEEQAQRDAIGPTEIRDVTPRGGQ